MSIIYKKDVTNRGDSTSDWDASRGPELEDGTRFPIECLQHYAGEVAYEGRVVRVYNRDVQVMSDIWETWRYATVIERDGSYTDVFVTSHYDEVLATATVDVPDAEIAKYYAHMKKQREKEQREKTRRLWMDAQNAARFRILEQWGKGDRLVVVKGRKVPKGTEGICIWTGSSQWGERCGIRDDEGTVHWTASSNVERADMNALAIMANGDWIGFENKQKAAQFERRRAALDHVKLMKNVKVKTVCGHTGSIFWMAAAGSRVGVRIGPLRQDVVWADADQVSRI